MKIRSPWLIRGLAFALSLLLRCWMACIHKRIASFDADTHPVDSSQTRFLYCFWHEGLIGPLKIRTQAKVLISQHADGELIAQVCEHLGFGTIRGSTTRGGCEALRDMIHCQDSHLAITPDGPRGPRRKLQPGAILVASLTGLPIIPVGIDFSRAWRFNSWDQFALPKPLSAVVGVVGPRIHIPAKLDREGLERWRIEVEQRLHDVSAVAEQWAREIACEGTAAPLPESLATKEVRISA